MNAPNEIVSSSCHALRRRRFGVPVAAYGHMPFFDHRDQREVREDDVRESILKGLGK